MVPRRSVIRAVFARHEAADLSRAADPGLPMDSCDVIGHTPPMRSLLVFGLLFALAACSGDPRSFGITGPGPPQAVAQPDPAQTGGTSSAPGVPTSGTYYGPTNAPVTGSSGFWGYN
jgi:hypothetical protein